MISFIFSLLPWYLWLGLLLVVVLLTYLGLLPVVLRLLRAVPWPVWVILGAGAVISIWLRQHDNALTKEVAEERNAFWQAREDAANKKYNDNLVALHRKLEIASANADTAARAHAAELAERDAQHQRDRTELERRRQVNVTAEAVRRCDLTRGVILQFNEGATRANGSKADFGAAAAGTGAVPVDASSGVTIDTLSRACESTQDALRTCRDQVTGWQTREKKIVKPWIAQVLEAFSTCIPTN